MKEISCKLLVIGAGPGGYVCAVRAGRLGVDTVIVEEGRLGGVCLNAGCIPSKALIHAAAQFEGLARYAAGAGRLGIRTAQPQLDLAATMAWKDRIVGRLNNGVNSLLKSAGVKIVHGRARFRDGKAVTVQTETGQQLVRAENIVIATGSEPAELPGLPFGGDVLGSTQALALQDLPESLAIIGAGYIGMELGMAFAKFGCKVTMVEAEAKILPLYDRDLTKPVAAKARELGIEILTGAKARGRAGDGALLVETGKGEERRIAAAKILVTTGRRPRLTGWGMEELVLDLDRGAIRVDEQCRTSMRGIFAIGDVTGEPMLAHRAMAQGEMVAEIVAGQRRSFDPRCIPAICFTDPEVVAVGLSPDAAREGGAEIETGMFPLRANGRAMTLGEESGFVRVVAKADDHVIVGIQAVGGHVGELASFFALAMEMGARLEDIAGTIIAHPTLGEAAREAALDAMGAAVHIA